MINRRGITMEIKLLRYRKVSRDYFINENYTSDGNILILVASGSFTVKDGDALTRVEPYQAMVLLKGNYYSRKADGMMNLHVFRFECKDKTVRDGVIRFKNTERIKSDIDFLEGINQINRSIDNSLYREHILSDIIHLYEYENSSEVYGSDITDSAIFDTVNYIEKDISRDFDMSELADRVNLSYVQFLRRFKKATGVTPGAFISDIRVKKACDLLSSTEQSIKCIGRVCGFENEYYFSNFFKKSTGFSPSAYRNETSDIHM